MGTCARPRDPLRTPRLAFALLVLAAGLAAGEAQWPFRVAVERGPDRSGRPRAPASALAWLPAGTLRGIVLAGSLGIEDELVADARFRAACAEAGLGLVFYTPHIFGVFHFWAPGSADGPRLERSLADLARISGRPELARVPWITMGHSTAGIFCRNVAYWRPDRVAAVLSFKSGNWHQAAHLPPVGSLVGIPVVAVNGQLETFGPEGGLRPELGRETQWRAAAEDLLRFRAQDPGHLMQMLVHPGQDHFHGGEEIVRFSCAFLRAVSARCLGAEPPADGGPVPVRRVALADGWLSDADPAAPAHPPAPYAEYAGDRTRAFWHIDRTVAELTAMIHRNLDRHQCLQVPEAIWLDDGDGFDFTVAAGWLDRMPESFGGRLGGTAVGHATTPVVFLGKADEPVAQIAPDRFRVLRPVKSVNIAAWNAGDDRYRSTGRWAGIPVPLAADGRAQSIVLPALAELPADAPPLALPAASSAGLPISYVVDYGPVVVVDGQLRTAVPAGAAFPLPARVSAHQIGRRSGDPVRPAQPTAMEFAVVVPAQR